MGVDVFFVLSGFLITTLLFAEHGKSGGISLGKFYGRRALRLYPALLAVLLVGVIFYKDLGYRGSLGGYGQSAAIAGTYLEDFVYGFTGDAHGLFGHTWSLAIEEQFYLCWPPLVILLLARRRDPLRWAAAGAIVSWLIAAAYALWQHPEGGVANGAYFLPWSRFSQLLAGCVLAMVVTRYQTPMVLRRTGAGVSAVVVMVGLVLAGSRLGRGVEISWLAPAIAIATCALIWHLNEASSPLRALLGWPPLYWLGRRSYGIYLIHLPVLAIVSNHFHSRRGDQLSMLVITLVLAALSYRYVEMPFLRMKKRFQVVPS